jgi:predicted SAM-dependent methyltransferase
MEMGKIISGNRDREMPRTLFFGCGGDIQDKAVNVDLDFTRTQIDRAILGANTWLMVHNFLSPENLPVAYFDHIEARMVMEHIHLDHVPSVLYTMNTILAQNGKLHIIVPNFEALAKLGTELLTEKDVWLDRDFRRYRELNFQILDPILTDSPGRGHKSLWTKGIARIWLESEGFTVESMSMFGAYGMFLDIRAAKLTEFSQATGI